MTDVFNFLLWILTISIFAKVILSFVVPLAGARPHPVLISINDLVTRVTEPILGPLRRVLPTFGMFDFSPMAALIILWFVRELLVRSA